MKIRELAVNSASGPDTSNLESQRVSEIIPVSTATSDTFLEPEIVYVQDFNFLKKPIIGAIGLDIETEVFEYSDGRKSGLFPPDTEIATVQISAGTKCWVVQIGDTFLNTSGVEWLRACLEDEGCSKIVHNSVFELSFFIHQFEKVGGRPFRPKKFKCTQIGEYVLAAGRSIVVDGAGWTYVVEPNDHPKHDFSLGGTIARRYGVVLDKDPSVRLSFLRGTGLTARQIDYAAWDAVWALRLYRDQLNEIVRAGMESVYDLDCANAEAVARMCLNGIPFDREKLQTLHDKWTADLVELEKGIRLALWEPGDGCPVLTKTGRPRVHKGCPVIKELNINSNADVPSRLRLVGVPVQSYEASELKRYRELHPVMPALIKYKELTTLTTRYTGSLGGFVHPRTNRIHCDYKTTITATGRGAVSKPPLQQIPKRGVEGVKIRSCFAAPPGFKLLRGDFSMIELRLIAELWDEDNMMKAFQDNLDLHILTGAAFKNRVVGSGWDVIRGAYDKMFAEYVGGDVETKRLRDRSKIPNFALGYGAGRDKYKEIAWDQYGIALTDEEANRDRSFWHALYPKVGRKHREVGQRLRVEKQICAETVEGRKRYVCGYSEALNHPIQGTSADMIKRAVIRMDRGLDVVLQVHDEIICLVEDSQAGYGADYLRLTMEEAGRYYLKKVPVVVEVSIVDSWGEK